MDDHLSRGLFVSSVSLIMMHVSTPTVLCISELHSRTADGDCRPPPRAARWYVDGSGRAWRCNCRQELQPVISHPRRRRCCLCLNSIEISSTARHNFNRQDGRRLRNSPVRCSVYLLSSRRRHVTGSWTQSAFLHGISPAPAGDTDTDVQMPIMPPPMPLAGYVIIAMTNYGHLDRQTYTTSLDRRANYQVGSC